MEIIVEEISRDHKLLNRYKLDQNTINIGRSYQSDIILSDPHVCPEHLQLSFNGEDWLAQDNNSLNGSHLEKSKSQLKKQLISSGDVISLGKSQIRIIFPDHPIAETVSFSTFENFINLMRHPGLLAANIILFTIIAGGVFYLSQPAEVNFTQLLVPAISMTLLFILWPCGVALISHLTKHDARTISQIAISFTFFNLLWLSDAVENIIDFNFSSHWPIGGFFALIPIALGFCLFWLNGYIGFHMSAIRRFIIAASMTGIFFGGSFLIQLSQKPNFSSQPNYNATIMTPQFILVPSSNVNTFLLDSEKLFDRAQQAAKVDKK